MAVVMLYLASTIIGNNFFEVPETSMSESYFERREQEMIEVFAFEEA
ncbi:hypothetical protein J19TS1_34640 [Heyndrickxia oleronia]|nr:hypothetical protein J19TS1_34640 [Heyndrickxia oleronia]